MRSLNNLLSAILGTSTTTAWSPIPAVAAVIVIVFMAVAGIIPYSLQTANAASVASVAILLGLAILLAGGALGFVFGVPRASQDIRTASAGSGYRGNTNLEQISDWLTKIIVGVGLVQIREIVGQVQRLISFLATGLGGQAGSQVFALAVLVYFSVAGFLIGFVTTRLLLGRALDLAEHRSDGQEPVAAQQSRMAGGDGPVAVEPGSATS